MTYYYGITRAAIVSFGSLFTNYHIFRKNKDKKIIQKINVPLSYAPKSKFLARIFQEPDIESKPFEVTLPRMSFEIESFSYDRSRKLNSNVKQTAVVDGQYRSMGNGVPYNLSMRLYVYAKNQEDALQIIEQILPKFAPQVSVSVNIMPEMGLTQNFPIILNDIAFEDNYEGDYQNHRTIIYTLDFTLQLNYYGAIDGYEEDICGITTGDGKGLIRRVEVDYSEMNGGVLESVTQTLNPFFADQDDFYTVDETRT